MAATYIEVACDESGNEGENLTRAGSRVFAHAGVSIDEPEALSLMTELRRRTGSKSVELKSSVLLEPANRDVLEWLLDEPRLVNKANVHLTDKRFFISGKIIDLIVETLMHERGHNLYRGRAYEMAQILYSEGPAQLMAFDPRYIAPGSRIRANPRVRCPGPRQRVPQRADAPWGIPVSPPTVGGRDVRSVGEVPQPR